jgi:predicted transposase YdaD
MGMSQNTILTYSEIAARKAERKGRKEVAKNLLEIGWDIEKVARTAELPVEVVKDIANGEQGKN